MAGRRRFPPTSSGPDTNLTYHATVRDSKETA
jgi:hypothetical protein